MRNLLLWFDDNKHDIGGYGLVVILVLLVWAFLGAMVGAALFPTPLSVRDFLYGCTLVGVPTLFGLGVHYSYKRAIRWARAPEYVAEQLEGK